MFAIYPDASACRLGNNAGGPVQEAGIRVGNPESQANGEEFRKNIRRDVSNNRIER